MKGSGCTVFVVDDEPTLLRAIARLLASAGWQAVTYASPAEFLEKLDPARPGCLVLDVSMPGLDGLALQEALAARGSELPIVFLTGKGDVPMSVRAMKRGAIDFLLKPVDERELLPAIERAFETDRARRRARAEREEARRRLATLTPRERQVLELVVSGRLNKQVAGELGTVEKTIKVHRGRVMEKMKAASLAELVRLAQRAGIGPR